MDDIIDMMVTEIIQETLQRLRNDNKEYNETIIARADFSDPVMKCLQEKLSAEELRQFEQYKTLDCHAGAIEQNSLYLQGFKDCFKLFKWIQM